MLSCERCGSSRARTDNYCRGCGAVLPRVEGVGDLALVQVPQLSPVQWGPARPRLWQGLAALAVGTVLEVLRREMVRRLATQPEIRGEARRNPTRALALPAQPAPGNAEEFELQEFFYSLRVIRRRH